MSATSSVDHTNKDNDKFTVNIEVGPQKLTYPVANLTADELTIK